MKLTSSRLLSELVSTSFCTVVAEIKSHFQLVIFSKDSITLFVDEVYERVLVAFKDM